MLLSSLSHGLIADCSSIDSQVGHKIYAKNAMAKGVTLGSRLFKTRSNLRFSCYKKLRNKVAFIFVTKFHKTDLQQNKGFGPDKISIFHIIRGSNLKL